VTPAPGRVAAVDCGTNSTRVLVLAPDGCPLERLMRITRLGQGVDRSGRLADEATARTLGVLSEFRGVIDRHGVVRTRLAATSAARDAANGAEFLAAAGRVIGVGAELLLGEEEGRLAYRGATAGLEDPAGAVVVDIGGGSTELVVDGPSGIEAISMPLGCVRLTERCLHHDPPAASELDDAFEVVSLELARAVRTVPALSGATATRLIGVAGTVSTLAALELGLEVHDPERTHHTELTASTVAHWLQVLAREPAAARLARGPMAPGREDVIVGGVVVLQGVMRALGFASCLSSESDILDGLAASLLEAPAP
jgi:exopolyphosphatase / guanosine-5'-triphosphate,3'-diphosphate pyrophosphatase